MPDHERTKATTEPHATSERTDTELVDLAFSAFYRETVKGLIGFLVVQGARLGDAADIAQDTMSDVYRRWSTIDHPRAWTYRVASRALIRKFAEVENAAEEPVEPSPLLRTADIEGWEQGQESIRLLKLLPPRQRQVMAWTLYGYTPAEIAHEISIEPSAVRSNLKKARRSLIRHLQAQEEDR